MIFWAQRCKIVKRCPKISRILPKKREKMDVGEKRWHKNVTNAHEMLETYLVRYDSGYGFGLSPCLSPLFSIFIFKNIKSFSVINWTSSSIRKSAMLNSYKCSKIKNQYETRLKMTIFDQTQSKLTVVIEKINNRIVIFPYQITCCIDCTRWCWACQQISNL